MNNISIAMTTFNGEKYLSAQLDSVLNQTYKDFELIICDDCSTDSTKQIISSYAESDSRIKFYSNKKNLGFKKNFEKAIQLCNNDYIALCDQDDIWFPEHLEKLINNIGNYDICCGDAVLIDKNGNSLNKLLSEDNEFNYFYNNDKLLYKILCTGNPFQGASMLLKKTFLKKSLPIPETIPFHDTWFSLCACLQNRIFYINDIITKYRQHDATITKRNNNDSFIKKIYNEIYKRFIKKNFKKSSRFDYIKELRNKFKISSEINIIFDNCIKYKRLMTEKVSFKDKINTLYIYFKNYKYIYSRKNNKFRTIRIIKRLVFN